MGLRINTNIASQNVRRHLSGVSGSIGRSFARVSSGLRIATSADDAAGLGISEKMRSEIRSLGVAARNAQDGVSMMQAGDGALDEVSNLLGRMRELAVQASNGTLDTADRSVIDDEFQQLDDEVNRIASTVEFNGISLLNSGSSVTFQVGLTASDTVDVDTVDASSSALGIDTIDVASVSNAGSALASIDAAISSVGTARGEFGSMQNVLQSRFRSLLSARENLSTAESRIRDADLALESAELVRNQIIQQGAVSVLSQANVTPQLALALL